MGALMDLTGQVFGLLTVEQRVTNSNSGQARWRCKCKCGKVSIATGTNLKSGNSQSCGCGWIRGWRAANARKFVDLTNKQFGRLTVIAKAFVRQKEWYWNCRCECGAEMIVNGKSLKRGLTKSCGCLQKEILSRLASARAANRPRIGGRFIKI